MSGKQVNSKNSQTGPPEIILKADTVTVNRGTNQTIKKMDYKDIKATILKLTSQTEKCH